MALPSRTQRLQRKHITEGTQPRRMLTEETDLHRAAVLHESKKNQLVKKWSPVLGKCREISQQKFGLMASILENQDPRSPAKSNQPHVTGTGSGKYGVTDIAEMIDEDLV